MSPVLLDFSPDQDGDGRPDVIASYRLPEGGRSGSGEPLEWSIVVSGRRGTALATLNSRTDPEEYSRWRLNFSDRSFDFIEFGRWPLVRPLAARDARAPRRVVEIMPHSTTCRLSSLEGSGRDSPGEPGPAAGR